MERKTVVSIEKTCIACPEVFKGKLDTGEDFMIRIRWGGARVEINDEVVHHKSYDNDAFKGMFENNDLQELLSEIDIDVSTDLIDNAKLDYGM